VIENLFFANKVTTFCTWWFNPKITTHLITDNVAQRVQNRLHRPDGHVGGPVFPRLAGKVDEKLVALGQDPIQLQLVGEIGQLAR